MAWTHKENNYIMLLEIVYVSLKGESSMIKERPNLSKCPTSSNGEITEHTMLTQ